MFKAPFSFDGRIRRTEFGLTYLGYMAMYFLIGVLDIPILGLLMLPALLILIAQSSKRCHDRGNSGWFQLVPFYFLWMLFAEGDQFENNYGPDPKNPFAETNQEQFDSQILDDFK